MANYIEYQCDSSIWYIDLNVFPVIRLLTKSITHSSKYTRQYELIGKPYLPRFIIEEIKSPAAFEQITAYLVARESLGE